MHVTSPHARAAAPQNLLQTRTDAHTRCVMRRTQMSAPRAEAHAPQPNIVSAGCREGWWRVDCFDCEHVPGVLPPLVSGATAS